jgi:hypothetical protein
MTLKKWQRGTLLVAGTLGVMYGMVYADVVCRAKEAYLEGEKYWAWTDHPDQRVKYLEEQLAAGKKDLQDRLAKGKLSQDEHDRRLELLEFDHQQQLKESTIKYAYAWYQSTVEQFSPPNSKWVKLAREKMPQAKERWKAELRAKNIPFEDYMIE